MPQFEEGDRVRVDIPDETDPDHDPYHGEHGTVIETIDDEAHVITGDPREDRIFTIELDSREEKFK
jgi:ribosomal protein L21E